MFVSEKIISGPSTPRAGAEDGRRGKERLFRTPATRARKPAKKEAGGGAKSVFARMLRTARRYLGDVGRGLSAESKPSPRKNAAAAGRFPRGLGPSSPTRVQVSWAEDGEDPRPPSPLPE
ncbi:hypothetical protein ANANG_G00209360 [Anguilla anguilla]|uniref:Uncharacterized protein n=1 Tax=Anguilla anguilla TaxID=7936 RepID=A0A9D3M1F4_ANGAN|nr:hypothetical protein ANANG_G00209360 [Anguilla anguilla]